MVVQVNDNPDITLCCAGSCSLSSALQTAPIDLNFKLRPYCSCATWKETQFSSNLVQLAGFGACEMKRSALDPRLANQAADCVPVVLPTASTERSDRPEGRETEVWTDSCAQTLTAITELQRRSGWTRVRGLRTDSGSAPTPPGATLPPGGCALILHAAGFLQYPLHTGLQWQKITFT